MSTTISATEANRHFAELLRRVNAGESFIVTSHGRPIARIDGVSEDFLKKQAAHHRLLERIHGQDGLRPVVAWTRDELYDDES